MSIKAPPGKVKGQAIARDRKGRPKIGPSQIERFYPVLSEEDRRYLRTIYPDHPYYRTE